MRQSPLAAALLAALIAASAPLAPAAGADRGSPAAAADLFAKAEEDFAALKADARKQRQHQNFVRVLDAYRRVFERQAATREAERALMRAGELYTLLFRWTGQEGDLNRAQNYYQRLIQNYPKSSLVDDARLAIAYLYLEHFRDPAQAWLKFQDVVRLSPEGDKAPEARRQIKRLARSAPTEPPLPISGPAGPTPQTPASPDAPSTVAAALPAPAPGMPTVLNRVLDIRHWSNPEYSRVVIDLDQKTNFYSNLLEDRSGSGKPPRLYVDLFTSLVEERLCKPINVNDGILLGIRAGQYTPDSTRVVLEIDGLHTYRVFPMQNPFRIVIDVTGGAPGAAVAPPAPVSTLQPPTPPAAPFTQFPVPEIAPLPPFLSGSVPAAPATPVAAPPPAAPPAASRATFSGTAPTPPVSAGPARPAPGPARVAAAPPPSAKPSLARQLGLGVRRVVIDAGHGAHDPGAIGIGGLQEKEVTLDLALRLRDLLQAAGYETVLTRDRDVYLPLEERTALANTARGDLFLSLHCNSSEAGDLSGVETYFLNLASNLRAMQTAARENSMAVGNMRDLQQIVREIQNSKMDESSQFAAKIQTAVHDALHRKFSDVRDLGVKQAPFYVLIGAQMPSVLAEVSFINHRTEGRRLADPNYRQLLAKAIADGVKRYVRTVKTAAVAPAGRRTP